MKHDHASPHFALRTLLALTVALVAWAPASASAALTASEQAQIKGFAAGADVHNAGRVRALVARPDLSADESAASLTDALANVAWTDARAAFFREMIFGGASLSARPALVAASTRAMIARGDAVLSKFAGDLDAHADALSELARLYAFLDGDIANAGHPAGTAHDPQAGIPSSTYDACVAALGDHLSRHPRWLKADAPLSPAAARVRAQAELALLDMMNDATNRKSDAADRLGLTGARRAFLTDLGVLLLDSGKADDTRVGRVRGLVDRLPAARVDIEAIYFGELHPPVRSRGPILAVELPLEASAAAGGNAAPSDRDAEVEPGPLDLPLFALGYELANVAMRRALDNRADLRVQVEHDLVPLHAKDNRAEMSLEQQLAATTARLITDAPRTLDLAFARFIGGRSATAALVSDALGVLAAFAPPGTPASGLVLPLGKPKAPDGETEPLPATGVRLAPNGAVVGFTLAGHRWELHRDDTGALDAVRRDGAGVTLAMLPTARVPLSDGPSWSGAGIVFARLQGSPRAGIAPGPRVRVVGVGAKGVDAIATPAPGDDVTVECDLVVRGEAAGVVVRAVSGKDAFQGASLLIAPGSPAKASLRANDRAGVDSELAPAVDLPSSASYRVRITVRGTKLDATVGGVSLKATLPPSLVHGDVALRVRRGATLEASAFSVKP